MGTAKVNVWIHDEAEPCRISDRTWLVNVTDCKNQVVEWCGTKYARIPAKCGHAEFRLPPGCYIIWAAVSVALVPPFLYANHITHFSIVSVTCEETACVHLYAPTYHLCWKSILIATKSLAKQKGGIPRDKAEQLVKAFEAVIEHVPKTANDLELGRLFEELPKMMEEKIKEEMEEKIEE